MHDFDERVAALLQSYGIPPDTELHAQPCLGGHGSFGDLEPGRRLKLLRDFIQVGMDHVVGLHYIAMLKPFVRDEIRAEIAKRGFPIVFSQPLHVQYEAVGESPHRLTCHFLGDTFVTLPAAIVLAA